MSEGRMTAQEIADEAAATRISVNWMTRRRLGLRREAIRPVWLWLARLFDDGLLDCMSARCRGMCFSQ